MTIVIISMIRDNWGGSEELWYDMAKAAIERGHTIIHLGYKTPVKHKKMQELEKLGVRSLQRPGWIPSSLSEFDKLFYLGKNYLRKKIHSPVKKVFAENPDVVIYNGTCYSISQEKELLKYIERKATRFYIIGHLNNEFQREINEKEAESVKLAYRLSKKVFFVSKRSLLTATRQLCTEIGNAAIIKNPVNLGSTEPIHFPSLEGSLQMACVGNLVTKHKGQDILFETLSKWENKNWTLNVYGYGYDKDYLVKLSHHLKLDYKIFFHGKTDDVRKIWATNHVLLMPSIMEGMPLAIVEAMICGRICIATDVGGISEWITEGENGFIAQAPTVPLILNALRKAWDVRHKWPEIAFNAHKAAMQQYDPSAGITLLNKIIE